MDAPLAWREGPSPRDWRLLCLYRNRIYKRLHSHVFPLIKVFPLINNQKRWENFAVWPSLKPDDLKFLLLLIIDLLLTFLLGTVIFHVTVLSPICLVLIGFIACILLGELAE